MPLSDIGTLTVDQSGTGRMQQTVEGARVRDVVGKAIVIYSQGNSQQTVPANLNGSAGTANKQGVIDSAHSSHPTDGDNYNRTGANAAARTPVAAGVIRLISDRRPPAAGNAGAPGNASGIEQPANAVPPTNPNLVR